MATASARPFSSLDEIKKSVAGVTSVDQESAAKFDAGMAAGGADAAQHEPRFLENVQLFVDRAASSTNIPEDLLKYMMACDKVLRF